ncbi:MAG: DEDD exonuclease domain-containing protein [Kutzneria sp.]|nr:DEDD exonuclease domain-containing protein [Kutzneria sp.]MBV9847140.1 DEDD exonuclease domain-containing protein [Kutzneria sp.]
MVTTPRHPSQLAFDELGTPLRDTTFVVVDLETTGGRADSDAITEVGAVKVRDGELLGEFATLVNPSRDIPREVVHLTGITAAMVSSAPTITQVLPALLEFMSGAVLVAHNAGFDIGFLRAACARHGYTWPKPRVVCTVRLARRVLTRQEAPSCRLSALSLLLGTARTPTHRALDDARATVDVLHALLERLGPLGVCSVEELLDYLPEVTPAQRRKRHLAAELPSAPGVYLFRGPSDQVLYVGTATDLRRRVRQYFTGSESRGRIREMVTLAARVDWVVCAHPLEAQVRELRLLAAHRPQYNRRSKNPRAGWWVVLTDEAFPRLSVVRRPRDGALGPFVSRAAADSAAAAVGDATGLRSCRQRIPARGQRGVPCALAELGRCGAPCAGRQDVGSYSAGPAAARDLAAGHSRAVFDRLADRVRELADAERFEQAAADRDRLVGLVRTVGRGQRIAALAALPELVAAHPDGAGGWELVVIRHGRLASAGLARRGIPPMPVVSTLVAAAETVLPGVGPLCGAPAEEAGLILRWLTSSGTRLVHCAQPWAEPLGSAAGWRDWIDRAVAGRKGYRGAN